MIAADAPPDFITRPGREDSLREPVGCRSTPCRRRSASGRRRCSTSSSTTSIPSSRGRSSAACARPGWGDPRLGGADTPDRLHYYRLHGPTLLIEYDKTDLDHAHSVWHDPTNLFGEDHLRAHHEAAHAHR